MMRTTGFEALFDRFLGIIEFRLVKYPDGWGLVDEMGVNLGDIEADRFDTAEAIIDRLDIYISDYFVSDIEDEFGLENNSDLTALLDAARKTIPPERLEYYRDELAILDMICSHPGEIDLETCGHTVEGEDQSANNDMEEQSA